MEFNAGAILCLQEVPLRFMDGWRVIGAHQSTVQVSKKWADKLRPVLESRGYTFETALGGKAFNGFMGQLLAWPCDRYETEEVWHGSIGMLEVTSHIRVMQVRSDIIADTHDVASVGRGSGKLSSIFSCFWYEAVFF